MHDQVITRRRAFEATAALAIGAGLCGCGRKEQDLTTGPVPTLGWETIAAGGAGPGPRSRHGLVYDKNTTVAVLFGGIIFGKQWLLQSDTWELRGRDWSRIRTPETPAARHRGAMVYLNHCGQSLLFGGQSARGAMLGDTWLYSARSWREQIPAVRSPSPRCGHSLAYDEKGEVAVLFGGIQPGDKPLGDTWVFDGKQWRQIVGKGPSPRRYAAFAYDPDLKGCLLHGGSEDDHGQRTYRETWLFRDNAWNPMAASFDTDPRDDHGLAYHRSAKRLVMLEGVNGARGVLARESAGWRKLDVNPLHPRHQCSPLAWDDDLGGMLLYGGEVKHGGPQFDATLLLRMPAVA